MTTDSELGFRMKFRIALILKMSEAILKRYGYQRLAVYCQRWSMSPKLYDFHVKLNSIKLNLFDLQPIYVLYYAKTFFLLII